jgi:hypothetical protein
MPKRIGRNPLDPERIGRRRPLVAACGTVATALMAIGVLGLSACSRPAPPEPPPVLLFNGTGTSANDVIAVEDLLRQMHVVYAPVNSAQLQRMTTTELRKSRLLIVPGGDFLAMGAGLSSSARANVHDAVQDGLNYLGLCAGAFLAGDASYPSLHLTPGVRFAFYAAARDGTRKAAVTITTPDGPPLEQYWEDGPQLAGWGAVAARYPDGTPAVTDGLSGRGRVILSGIHAEAPESWRGGLRFTTPARVDNAFARDLIDAALHGTALPHF